MKADNVLGQATGENGYENGVYVLLPDNTFPVATPVVSGSDCYDFAISLFNRVTVTGLTVVSNATEINATNWAAVKATTNDYV